jgi:hypothetical protein
MNKKLYNKFDAAVPGQSLTKKAGAQAWETPPRFETPDEFLMATFAGMTSKQGLNELGALTKSGRVSIEDLVKTTLLAAITDGDITPDVAILSAEALAAQFTAVVAGLHQKEPLMSHKKPGPSDYMIRMSLLDEYEKKADEIKEKDPETPESPPSGGLLSPRTS